MSARATVPAHDMALFARLRAAASQAGPPVRDGRMFGCPALYVGRRMMGCVFGDEVGLRVPAAVADAARASGRARHFTPHGRAPMREWIAIGAGGAGLDAAADLVRAAAAFAAENDASGR